MFQNITYNDLYSEEDLRTKIVYNWLIDKGISDKEIFLETTFTINLGKGKKTISGRSDFLVRKSDGTNLLIIEVKKVDHKLNEDDKRQAISYAKTVDGGIAPFTILTNGKETQVFDSVTEKLISNKSIPTNHPYISNGFKPSGDLLTARFEALEYLISLSKENLIAFCNGQVYDRMRLLKSTDIYSGKKYIPQLYIDRKKESNKLKEQLFEKGKNLVLLTSPPQFGKTCFTCNAVENYLKDNVACLFYPAIVLRYGLLNTIKEDFNWLQNSNDTALHIINRLHRILEDTDQKLLLFIDGWNELDENIALQLNEECSRLENRNIKIILSCTSFSVRRLLFDNNSNPEYISDITGINKSRADILYNRRLNSVKGAHVQLDDFESDTLMEKAKSIYEAEYNTKIPTDKLLRNPFYLRLFAELYPNRKDIKHVDNSVLINKSITSKAKRAGIDEVEVLSVLGNLALSAFEYGVPIDITTLNNIPRKIDFEKYEDAGLLTFGKPSKDIYEIDFYYTIDRNYMISIGQRKWHKLFSIKNSKSEINSELEKCNESECSLEALKWFLSCPEFTKNLKYLYENHIDEIGFTNVKAILEYSVIQNSELIDINWFRKVLNDQKPEIILAFLKKCFESNLKNSEEYEHWFITLIKIDEKLITDIRESYTYSLLQSNYGEELRYLAEDDGLFDLEEFLQDSLVSAITNSDEIYLKISNMYSDIFLKNFVEFLFSIRNKLNKEMVINLQGALASVMYEYNEMYYGSICPGIFNKDDLEDGYTEFYINQMDELQVFIKGLLYFSSLAENSHLEQCILGLYEDLMNYAGYSNKENQEKCVSNDPNQLKLPFDKENDRGEI